MDLSDVDYEAAVIRVHGKGNRQRLVPLGQKALTAIKTYRDRLHKNKGPHAAAGRPLFLNRFGKRLLGPKSLSTTQKCTDVSIDRLMETYDKAHPRK